MVVVVVVITGRQVSLLSLSLLLAKLRLQLLLNALQIVQGIWIIAVTPRPGAALQWRLHDGNAVRAR